MALSLVATAVLSATDKEPAPKLIPGTKITTSFPDMPPTFNALAQKKEVKAQMTVFLPFNYAPGRKFQLLVLLNGGDGGDGGDLGVARSLCHGKDFHAPLQGERSKHAWCCVRHSGRGWQIHVAVLPEDAGNIGPRGA